ncbi:unnamed protein product [Porites evermanni]|uniref:RING-type domain-containing protein n=1 Tax=Porites evermanni TaxID=104178 RepID=A0ABN8QVN6_9CNID|nr:unnamed protein product [Porites evermanni]
MNLDDLCRVCGERLQKSKKAVTSKFLCMKWKDFLAENLKFLWKRILKKYTRNIFVILHSCYAHPDRRTLVKATWLTHYDDNCRVCSHVEGIKKGGRPKKPKRGRKADSGPSFSNSSTFPENRKRDLICPVCLQVLDKPVETTCQHYFCVECLKGLINSAVCKEKVGPVKIPTRMVLKLIAEQEPLGVVHVPVAQKLSDEVTARRRLNRTKAIETVGKTISSDQMDVHMVQTLKRKGQEERRQILNDALGKELVLHIPEGQANAMKADLGITWYRLNKLRRYVIV